MKNNSIIVQTVVTADGSVTLKRPDLEETYHSIHGAVQESMHVFIQAGLNYVLHNKSNLKILEMGFGTGLNAYLTAVEIQNTINNIEYIAIEKFPLANETYDKLNYALDKKNRVLWENICFSEWNQLNEVVPNFSLNKIESDLYNFSTEKKFDLVYYDAFGPRVQPELWTQEVFEKIFSFMNDSGVLVTYCAKGEVKRNLKACGFSLESLQGPPGKREMTRAIKP